MTRQHCIKFRFTGAVMTRAKRLNDCHIGHENFEASKRHATCVSTEIRILSARKGGRKTDVSRFEPR
jgi:hypothetical protein